MEDNNTGSSCCLRNGKEYVAHRKRTIIKNNFILDISIMLAVTSTMTMDKLQSSVHFAKSLGTVTLTLNNLFNLLGALFISNWLVQRFGTKTIYAGSLFGSLIYILGNIWDNWYCMVAAAVISGLFKSCFYVSLLTFLGAQSAEYAQISGLSQVVMHARVFGLYFFFSQAASIWGNLVSFEVLKRDPINTINSSLVTISCGVDFCDYNVPKNNNNFQQIPTNFYLLCGVFAGICISSIILSFFLENMTPKLRDNFNMFSCLFETIKMYKKKYIWLSFPITFYGGLQASFITSDYTKSYITCSFGVADVGYLFTSYGVVSTVFALVSAHVVKILGRSAVFVISACIDIGVYSTLIFFDFRSYGILVHFLLLGLLGISQGVWQGQVKALYGSLFSESHEAAFAVLGIGEAAGIMVGFSYSGQLCTLSKLLLLYGWLVVGMIGYGIIECSLRKGKIITEK